MGSSHRLRQVSELASIIRGVTCVQVPGQGLGLPGEVFSWCKKMRAAGEAVRRVAWAGRCALPVRTIVLCLQSPCCSTRGKALSWVETALGWIWPPRCLSDDCGVGEGTALRTQTALSAQTHARAGKHPELWNGCVMAAPGWCDRHMIFLWHLLLKDKHLPYF